MDPIPTARSPIRIAEIRSPPRETGEGVDPRGGAARARRRARTARAALSLFVWGIGCGGTQSSATTDHDENPAIERAVRAWSNLDLRGAAEMAERDLGRAEGREIAARSRLALGEPLAALRALGEDRSPALLELRARAEMELGRWADAHQTLRMMASRGETDPWVEAMTQLASAAADRELYETEGASDATLALVSDAALPLARVEIDGRERLALIGTSAEHLVLDPRLAATAGVLDELGLGAMRVRGVTFTVRDLEPVREALGAPVELVLGARLLLALRAEIDGPAAELRLHAAGAAATPDATRATFYTPNGALVVEGRVTDEPSLWALDTAGLFPVAVAEEGLESLGLDDVAWQATSVEGTTLHPLDALTVGTLRIEGVPIVRGLLDAGQARALSAPVAGSLGWQLLAQLRMAFEPERRSVRFD